MMNHELRIAGGQYHRPYCICGWVGEARTTGKVAASAISSEYREHRNKAAMFEAELTKGTK